MVSKKKSAKKDKPKHDFSEISYVIGVVALVFSFISPLAGIVFGILGLTHSNKQKTNLSQRAKNLSIAAIVVSVVILLLVLFLMPALGYGFGTSSQFPAS